MADQKLTGVSGAKTPKLNTLNKDPVSQSVLKLLTLEDNKPRTKGQAGNKDQIPKATLDRISQITSTTIDANSEMMESVPGTFKALSILQSAILSPRDLTSINLSYKSESYEGRNNDLNTLLMNRVEDYVEGNYKITDRLSDILANVLFYKGGEAIALLSSSSLDNVINGHVKASLESLVDDYKDGEFVTRGWLGDNDKTLSAGVKKASLESLLSGEAVGMTNNVVGDSNYNVTVTDNDSILRMPQLKLTLARNAMAKKVAIPRSLRRDQATRSYGIEALDEKGQPKNKDGSRGGTSIAKSLSDDQYVDIYNQLFKQRDYKQSDIVEMRRDDELTQENVDAVLWKDLPLESVVPIHLPGNPRARIGAYVVLDGDGNAVSSAMNENKYQDPMQNQSDTANAIDGTKGIIAMAQEYKSGNSDQFSMVDFRKKVTNDIEKDLVQRIVNGTFAQKVALGMTDEIKDIMFARAMRNLKTKVLFIPEEALVYFAFDYNRFGIGRSLLERSRLYASMAMANVISTTLANISASTNVTTLGINLDPDNPEPDQTIEAIVTTHLNSNRTMSSLIGARNPRDVINIMDEAGVIVKTNGHPGYPDIDVDVSYDKRNVTPPDAEWNDRLLEMLWGMWEVDPALLSTQNAAQFAIEHINNNALFRKSTGVKRKMFCNTLSELVQKIVMKSGNLMNDLYKIIADNKKLWAPTSKKGKEQLAELKEEHPEIDNNDQSLMNFILVNFINSITLTLPEPMEGDIDEQNRAYDTMRQRYENAIKDLFPDDILSYILGDSADTSKFEMWRNNLVSHKMREWMAGSGSYEDITALCEIDDESNASITLLASMVSYNKQTLEGMIEYLKLSNEMKGKIQESFAKLEADGHLDNNPAEGGFNNGADEFSNPGGEGGEGGFNSDGTDPGATSDPFNDNADPSLSADNGGGNDLDDLSGQSTDNSDAFADTAAGGEPGADAGEGATGEAAASDAGAEASLFSAESTDGAVTEGEEGKATETNGEGVPGEPNPEDEVPEPELDKDGNPIEPAEPELDKDGNPIDPDAPPVDLNEEDFEEHRQDEHSDMDFKDGERHDDSDLNFDENSDGNEDLEFSDAGDGKPKGRDRKSKRTQKKEAKKAKEGKDKDSKDDKAADDELNFS